MTISEFLYGAINFDIPEEAMSTLLAKREVNGDTLLGDVDKKTRDLLEADLCVWVAMGASRKGAVSDSDNGWSHSEGSYTLTEEDKRLLLSRANLIYEEYGEAIIGKTRIRMRSLGIQNARRTIDGEYLPHIER